MYINIMIAQYCFYHQIYLHYLLLQREREREI